MKISKFIICLILLVFTNLQAQNITGKWYGSLNVGRELQIVFNINNVNGEYNITMDSPDQEAYGIKVDEVNVKDSKIELKVNSVNGKYNGEIIDGENIKGKWWQNGFDLELNLRRNYEKVEIKRPQTPKPPFNYNIEEVKILNKEAGINLSGTFTYPKGNGKFPAVVLISGSGVQDRDETIFNHKPFWVIADHLTKNGIAVLRYDDRGFGKSEGNFASATTEDFASDTKAVFEFLRKRNEVYKKSVGFVGHSEGGMVASILGSELEDVGFIILLAAPGVSGYELLVDQVRDINTASGLEANVIEHNVELQKNVLDIVIEQSDDSDKKVKLMELINNETQVNQVLTPWFKFFVAFDPQDILVEIECPVLAINGNKDIQVNSKKNLTSIESALKIAGNKKFEIIELGNMNHLFQECETGLMVEYGKIEQTFSPKVLEIMTSWILGIK